MILKKTHKKITNNLNHGDHLLKTGSYGFKVLSNIRLTERQVMCLERNLKIKSKKLLAHFRKPKI